VRELVRACAQFAVPATIFSEIKPQDIEMLAGLEGAHQLAYGA